MLVEQAGYRGDVERCPECQRNIGEFRPWPIYTVRLGDSVERCARCLRMLNPSLDLAYSPPPVMIGPQIQFFQSPLPIWPTVTVESGYWLRPPALDFTTIVAAGGI